MATKKVMKPDVVRGGIAIPLKGKTNYYYMSGRKHKNGGIDIGRNPRTGLEVEDGEVMHIADKEIKVFSSVPFLNGKSPAQKLLGGENPDTVFRAQEAFKDRNSLNDDGTKKRMRGLSRSKDYGSKSKPYPNVKSKDFAGGNRSYPIPTKADAVDALRLAGLHGRDDVKTNVYDKYPELRKKAKAGGIYSVTVDGKTTLKRFPSTGSRAKAALGAKKRDETVQSFNLKPFELTKSNLEISSSLTSTPFPIKFPVIEDDKKTYTQKNQNAEKAHKAIVNYNSLLARNATSYNTDDTYLNYNNDKSKEVIVPLRSDITNNKNIDKPKEFISPLQSNVPKENYVDPGLKNTYVNTNIIKNHKLNPIPVNNFRTKFKNYIKEHPNTVSDVIGLASNTIGGLISHNINRRMLDKLDYFPQPMARSAAKLKTRININPQLDKMRESLAAYENDINNSTSSSNVALARRQRARFANTLQTNNIYANRENTETELINKDRLNQQSVADANIRDYNTWLQNQTTFRNSLLEKKAENDIGLIETINSGIQNMLTNREKRNTEKQNVAAMSLANPDLPVEVLYEQGLISKRVLDAYRKAYRVRKKENNENNKETNNV